MKICRVLLCALLLSGLGWAGTVEITGVAVNKTVKLPAGDVLDVQGTGHHLVVQGEGGSLRINGTGSEVTVEGKCASVTLNGTGNRLRVDATAQGVAVDGMGNTVILVKRKNRPVPNVTQAGMGHTISTENL